MVILFLLTLEGSSNPGLRTARSFTGEATTHADRARVMKLWHIHISEVLPKSTSVPLFCVSVYMTV